MARYIDADSLLEQISKKKCEVGKIRYLDGFNDGLMRVRSIISAAPTADVVPKSEVDLYRHQVDELEDELASTYDKLEDAMRGAANSYKMHYENSMKEIERLKDYNTNVAFKHYFDGRKEAAREIFEEIESKKIFLKDCVGNMGVVVLFKDISELKKKYTEEKK